MKQFKILLYAVIMVWGLCTAAQTPRITITKFEQNAFSLIAKMDPVRDANGDDCAVIRFFVSDRYYSVDEALRTDTLIGEMRTWIPKGTKRITVRHEGMLPLIGYEIPLPMESKNTYEATVEILNEEVTIGPNSPSKQNHPIYVGVGYSISPVQGFSAAIGFLRQCHNLEISAIYGTGKTDDLYFYDSNGNALAAYSYHPVSIQGRYGYEIGIARYLIVIPQIGGAYNIAVGKRKSDFVNTNSKYQIAHSFSVIAAASLLTRINSHIAFEVTPEYHINLQKDHNSKWISDSDKTFSNWMEGVGIRAGLVLFF